MSIVKISKHQKIRKMKDFKDLSNEEKRAAITGAIEDGKLWFGLGIDNTRLQADAKESIPKYNLS